MVILLLMYAILSRQFHERYLLVGNIRCGVRNRLCLEAKTHSQGRIDHFRSLCERLMCEGRVSCVRFIPLLLAPRYLSVQDADYTVGTVPDLVRGASHI